MADIYRKIAELAGQNKKAALCTIVSTKGSTPLKAGAKMIVLEDKTSFGTVGGGSAEYQTIEKATEVINSGESQLINIDLTHTEEAICGGEVEIFVDPIKHNRNLYIFGAGHVGKETARLLQNIDFNITVIDNRENIFDGWNFNGITTVNKDFEQFLKEMQFDSDDFIVILTYNHLFDWDILSYCIDKPHSYIGVISSRKKAATMKEKLGEQGISQNVIDSVDMPIGLKIKAKTAEEIAVSIAGKLIEEKNKDLSGK